MDWAISRRMTGELQRQKQKQGKRKKAKAISMDSATMLRGTE
jgi:hypothetical protein